MPPSVQDEEKMPVPLLVNETVPLGVMTVPGDVSVAVALHIVCWLTTTVAELHVTAVVVARGVTVM